MRKVPQSTQPVTDVSTAEKVPGFQWCSVMWGWGLRRGGTQPSAGSDSRAGESHSSLMRRYTLILKRRECCCVCAPHVLNTHNKPPPQPPQTPICSPTFQISCITDHYKSIQVIRMLVISYTVQHFMFHYMICIVLDSSKLEMQITPKKGYFIGRGIVQLQNGSVCFCQFEEPQIPPLLPQCLQVKTLPVSWKPLSQL